MELTRDNAKLSRSESNRSASGAPTASSKRTTRRNCLDIVAKYPTSPPRKQSVNKKHSDQTLGCVPSKDTIDNFSYVTMREGVGAEACEENNTSITPTEMIVPTRAIDNDEHSTLVDTPTEMIVLTRVIDSDEDSPLVDTTTKATCAKGSQEFIEQCHRTKIKESDMIQRDTKIDTNNKFEKKSVPAWTGDMNEFTESSFTPQTTLRKTPANHDDEPTDSTSDDYSSDLHFCNGIPRAVFLLTNFRGHEQLEPERRKSTLFRHLRAFHKKKSKLDDSDSKCFRSTSVKL